MSKLLLIVDVQKGFINEFTQHIPERVQALQYDYEFVVATKFISEKNSFYRTLINWNKFSRGTVDVELAFLLKKGGFCFEKSIYSCVSNEFVSFLNTHGISKVDVVGMDTDICVTKCAVDLFEVGVAPCVLARYCASHAGDDIHQRALNTLERYIGKNQVLR